MRGIFTFFVSLLLPVLAMAQVFAPVGVDFHTAKNQNKAATGTLYLVNEFDFSIYVNYQGNDMWVVFGKELYQYNDQNKWIQTDRYQLDTVTAEYVLTEQKFITRDIDQRITEKLYKGYNPDSGYLINMQRYLYTYDDYGYQLTEMRQVWDLTASQWSNSYLDSTYYDADGKLLQEVNLNWDFSLNQWAYFSKDEYQYDSAGNLVVKSSYSWDNANAQWTPSEKIEYVYNNGLMSTETHYFYDTGSQLWYPAYRVDYFYNDNGDLTEAISFTVAGYAGGVAVWQNNMKYQVVYDAQGRHIADTTFMWDSNDSVWVYDENNSAQYDGSGNLLQNIKRVWDTTNNQWLNQEFMQVAYNLSASASQGVYPDDIIIDIPVVNLPVSATFSAWDTTSQSWVYQRKYTLVYGEVTTPVDNFPDGALLLYPNPASDYVYLNVAALSPSMVWIYDRQGRLVDTKVLAGNVLNVKDLPSGVYFVKVQTRDGVKTSKFIKR